MNKKAPERSIPPNIWPYNRLSQEEGEARAIAGQRARDELKAQQEAEKRRKEADAARQYPAQPTAPHHHHHRHPHHHVARPFSNFDIPPNEVMERDRIIANERRLLKEREDREQQERKAREAYSKPVDRFGMTTAPLRRSPEPARTYPVYGGYMTYQPPKPAEVPKRKEEEQKRVARPERPYVYKPEPLPGPVPPSATGREYTYNPRDKRPRMDAAVDSANRTKRPKHSSRPPTENVLPESYRRIGKPPGGIAMENAPRDWSKFSEERGQGNPVTNDLIAAYLDKAMPVVREAAYTGKDWTAADLSCREGDIIKLFISAGFLNKNFRLRSEPGWEDADPAWHLDAMDLQADLVDREALVVGKLWGTDVYTDDSDIGAILVHAGFIRWDEWRAQREEVPAPGKSGIEVHLRVLPPMVRYVGTRRRGVRSRAWGNSHDGNSIMVEHVARVEIKPVNSRKGRKARMRELALQRRVVMGDVYGKEHGLASTSAAVQVIDKGWMLYNHEDLYNWLDDMSQWSIWTMDLQLLGTDGKEYEFYHLGGDVKEPRLFGLYTLDKQSVADQIGLEDVYFLPAGLAFREDYADAGVLLPLSGYRWVVRSPQTSFKFEHIVGPIRTQSLKEAREVAGRYGKAWHKRGLPDWAVQLVGDSVGQWKKERADALIRRGWDKDLERSE